jgi:uncharacterized coiled-coil protein SlyX
MEKQFRQSSLKRGKTQMFRLLRLIDYRMKLDRLGSSISENQFILHILNNMAAEYDLKLAMMEKSLLNDKRWLVERLNEKTEENQDVAIFGGQFQGNCFKLINKSDRTSSSSNEDIQERKVFISNNAARWKDYRMKLDELESSISENQFTLHILNNMTADNNLQLTMMENRLHDKINPLTVDEIRDDLNLRYERLNEKNGDNENEDDQDVAFFGG